LWKVDREQTVHSMIEKGHPLARFGRGVDEIFKEGSRQTTPERFAPGGIDTQSVALETIRRQIVARRPSRPTLANFNPCAKHRATGACANDYHLERFANHDSSPMFFFIVELGAA
jgi:hypothetical protein